MAKYLYRSQQWKLPATETFSRDYAFIGLLMDLRDELQRLNNLLHCPNFQAVPRKLDQIRANTTKPRKRKRTSDRASKP